MIEAGVALVLVLFVLAAVVVVFTCVLGCYDKGSKARLGLVVACSSKLHGFCSEILKQAFLVF